MQFSLYILLTAAAAAGIVSAAPAKIELRADGQVKYDPLYDDAAGSMSSVSCSDGSNGLANRWSTFGSVPNFSAVGGYGVMASPLIAQWNDPNCGKCYSIKYGGKEAWVLAVDKGATYNVGQGIMDYLTGNRAVEFGTITADISEMDCARAGWAR